MKTGTANVELVAGPPNRNYKPGDKVTADDDQMDRFAALGQVTLDAPEAPPPAPKEEDHP